MKQSDFLEKLLSEKKLFKVGIDVFDDNPTEQGVKEGSSFLEILKVMKKASNEKLIRLPDNASISQ